MGGPGSGNRLQWHRSRKKTVDEDCLSLDANRWTREGILAAGASRLGSWQWTYQSGTRFSINYDANTTNPDFATVRLWYSWTWRLSPEEQSADYRVRLTTTQPRFGGLRWWFVCPLIVNGLVCNRRVGKLYLLPGERYFGCRHCHQLTYTSCQESHKYDGLYRHLAGNLGWDFDIVKWAMDSIGKRR